MDDSQRVIDWVLNHADQIQLSVKSYNWSEIIQSSCNIKDCQASITVDNKKYFGRGTALSEEESFLKAIGEAFDRYLFGLSNKLTTNGFAIHLTPQLAKQNAINELIERDRFFCHFLTQTPFYKTEIKIKELPISSNIFEYLDKNKIKFDLLEMRKLNDHRSYIFFVHGENHKPQFGFSFGLGCSLDAEKAACSAIIEGLVNLFYRIDNQNFCSINIDQFMHLSTEFQNGNPNKIDILKKHEELAFNLDYYLKVQDLFLDPKQTADNITESIDQKLIKYEQLKWPNELNSIPLYGYHAESSGLQNIFFGHTTEQSLNFKRLSLFTGKTISWHKVQKLPHPLD